MKQLSRKDIEAIAERVVQAYMKLPELQGQNIQRIEPVLLCEELLNLNIDFVRLSLDGSLLGLTSFTELGIEVYAPDDSEAIYYLDGKTVLIDSDLRSDVKMEGRCNFTITHEASHQILKMLYPKEYGARANRQIHYQKADPPKSRRITDWEEWQANTLASAILLPRQLVERAMYMFGLGKKVYMLNKVNAPAAYSRFQNMALFLGSSKTALAIRMKYLGLLERDYLDDPEALVRIEVD